MKEYRTVDISTLKGLKEAERLKAAGWVVVRSGMFSLQFERTKPAKRLSLGRGA